MNLFFIKIGKALSAIKNDGVMSAMKRILGGVWAIVRPVGSGSVLFISGGTGDSARYRTKHVAEFLQNHGVLACYTVQDRPFLHFLAKPFSVIVLHRVHVTPRIKSLMKMLQKQGKTVIFETDDLVFDKKHLQYMDILNNMNALEKKQYENGVGAEILADSYVELATTSTSYLGEKLRECGKKVFIVPQMLSREDVQWAENIVQQSSLLKTTEEASLTKGEKKVLEKKSAYIPPLLDGKRSFDQEEEGNFCVLGYFSGTKSHDKDFATITQALIQIMERYQNIYLFIAGPLTLEDAFMPFADRIIRSPFSSRKKYFQNMALVNINLAPLEIGNPFCESKSEIKWMEAGIVGVPTVASATQTFREAINHGVDGLVAENSEEWYTALSRLIEDEGERKKIGKNAQQMISSCSTTMSNVADDYLRYVKERIVYGNK